MGFFSKIWKGLKGGINKIGKTIKKGFIKMNEFFGKFGILGQVAMTMFLNWATGGIAEFFMQGLGKAMGVAVQTSSGQALSFNAITKGMMSKGGIARVVGTSLHYGKLSIDAVKYPFKTITSGLENFSKGALNGVGELFGKETAFFEEAGMKGFLEDVERYNKKFTTTHENFKQAAEVGNLMRRANINVDEGAYEGAFSTQSGMYVPKLEKIVPLSEIGDVIEIGTPIDITPDLGFKGFTVGEPSEEVSWVNKRVDESIAALKEVPSIALQQEGVSLLASQVRGDPDEPFRPPTVPYQASALARAAILAPFRTDSDEQVINESGYYVTQNGSVASQYKENLANKIRNPWILDEIALT